jgi:predicted AlkP superfamily pyrophosphatase or phosphodiesterase
LALGLDAAQAQASPPPSNLSPSPKLVLVISVDQMRFDYLTRFNHLYQGGFRTLLDGGAVFTNALYRHAVTSTGPGHAVILTGRHPSHSGIAVNHWFDRELGRRVSPVEDPSVRTVGAAGYAGTGASPHRLLSPTVGDALKRAQPAAKVVSVANKSLAAILLGGLAPDAAYWFHDESGSYVTSSYYAEEAPKWLRAFNATRFAHTFVGQTWEPLQANEEVCRRPDSEGPPSRTAGGESFSHPITSHRQIPRSPFGDCITFEMVKLVVENHRLGTDEVPDLLAVGFSVSDIIGHDYGPFSEEAKDEFLRLDKVLRQLLDWLGQRVGKDRLLVVLTADHGGVAMPEHLARQGKDARRIRQKEFEQAIFAGLRKGDSPPGGPIIQHIEEWGIFLNLKEVARLGLTRTEAENILAAVLQDPSFKEQYGVAGIYARSELLETSPGKDEFVRFYRNSYFDGRSPDLFVRFKENYLLAQPGINAGHGTPYKYDRHVPVIFLGALIRPGNYEQEAGPEDIAPTLACILGLEFPREDDSRLLLELIERAGDAPSCSR